MAVRIQRGEIEVADAVGVDGARPPTALQHGQNDDSGGERYRCPPPPPCRPSCHRAIRHYGWRYRSTIAPSRGAGPLLPAFMSASISAISRGAFESHSTPLSVIA